MAKGLRATFTAVSGFFHVVRADGEALRRHRAGGYARLDAMVRLLVAMLIVSVAVGALPVRGQEPPDYAGIVIRPGDGTVTYAYVPLEEPVSGIELLRRSGVSLLTVGFGGLGEGVCKIEETGCEIGPCRTRLCQTGDRDSPYWRYFQQNDQGKWVASPLGGSATKIAPGDVHGWSWTSDEALLPEVDVAAIPELAQAQDDRASAHYARYDANGALIENGGTLELVSKRSYAFVLVSLAGMAIFALTLRFRPRRSI